MAFFSSGRVLTRFIIALTFTGSILNASASALGTYVPPPNRQEPVDQTISGGSRRGGCNDNTSHLDLMALVPQQHIGQTVTSQPTLVWYVPDEQSYEVRLNLAKYAGGGAWTDLIKDRKIADSQQGYMSYTIPADLSLETGSIYEWQIVLVCNPDSRSTDKVTSAQIEVVNRPIDLGSIGGERIQQAQQYASVGLWYDAMALLSGSSLPPGESAYRSELLTSLAEFENRAVGAQLRLIAEAD
ncbi:MAG: DUF928 domain-containing protein [Cyanobacteria bacterium P01_B01_bin.77]